MKRLIAQTPEIISEFLTDQEANERLLDFSKEELEEMVFGKEYHSVLELS